ncbi:MAG: TolC family protein [Deltaproteobacteria bacterium]|nr:TolC family protein [Deltaproteobacteria bacterium]MBW2414028.1 TolC family protein [Deltaproteobacteria bacterium]
MAQADQPAAGGSGGAATTPVPAPPGIQPEPAQPQGDLLTLKEALRFALQNNLDIELARYQPAISEEVLRGAEGIFDPLLFADYDYSHDETPIASAIVDGVSASGGGTARSTINTDTGRWDAGLSGVTSLGLEYSSQYEFSRNRSDSPFANVDPEYNAQWVTLVTLPLLRDLVTNDASILVARSSIARDRSYDDFQADLTDLLVETERRYWGLAAARANTRVATKSLETASELLEQTRVQYEVGVVSRVEVVQSEAGVAQREFELIVAENAEGAAHDQLLNAVFAPGERVFEERTVITEKAVFVDYEVEVGVATAKALELRPELASARSLVDDARLQLDLAENQVLPTLDLVGRYQFDGLSGRSDDPNTIIPNNRKESYDKFFRNDGNRSYTIGAQFSIPIGNQVARAAETEAEIGFRRAKTSLRREEQKVLLEVRKAVRDLASSIEGIQAAERNRVAQSETLDAEQERLRLGDSTPFQVLQHEEDLAQAERQLIRSLQVHRDAIADLDRAQGTLLDRLNISVRDQLTR